MAKKVEEVYYRIASTKFFEVRDAGAKGLGAFARQRISATTCILTEKPILLIRKAYDEVDGQDIVRAYDRLDADKKKLYDSLRDGRQRLADGGINAKSFTRSECIVDQFRSNKHTVTNVRTGVVGLGVYSLCSLLNHSCRSNCTIDYDDSGTRRVYAHENIEKGQELTFTYISQTNWLTTEQRKDELSFACRCELCMSPPKLRLVSDARRTMARALSATVHRRQDPAVGGHGTSECPRLTREMVEEIKTSSDNGFWSWTTVHHFMLAKLLEAEGLMIPDTMLHFARAAGSLIHMADNAGLERLPPRDFENMKAWAAKAGKVAKKIGWVEEDNTDMARLCRAIMEVLQAVGENGELPGLEKIASFPGGVKGGRK